MLGKKATEVDKQLKTKILDEDLSYYQTHVEVIGRELAQLSPAELKQLAERNQQYRTAHSKDKLPVLTFTDTGGSSGDITLTIGKYSRTLHQEIGPDGSKSSAYTDFDKHPVEERYSADGKLQSRKSVSKDELDNCPPFVARARDITVESKYSPSTGNLESRQLQCPEGVPVTEKFDPVTRNLASRTWTKDGETVTQEFNHKTGNLELEIKRDSKGYKWIDKYDPDTKQLTSADFFDEQGYPSSHKEYNRTTGRLEREERDYVFDGSSFIPFTVSKYDSTSGNLTYKKWRKVQDNPPLPTYDVVENEATYDPATGRELSISTKQVL